MSSIEEAAELKKDLIKRGVRGLALDIDETLSYTNERWFDHLFKHHPPPGKTKEELFRRQDFVEDIPEWQAPHIKEFIHQTVHSNEFQEDIPLIEGADTAVRDIHGIVPIAAYITARPDSVRAGTLTWLGKHKFPDAALIMRDTVMDMAALKDRNVWKAGILAALYPEILGIVDDNIGLAHELELLDYQGTLYLYGPQSEAFAGHPRVVVCGTWPDVVAHMKRLTR